MRGMVCACVTQHLSCFGEVSWGNIGLNTILLVGFSATAHAELALGWGEWLFRLEAPLLLWGGGRIEAQVCLGTSKRVPCAGTRASKEIK